MAFYCEILKSRKSLGLRGVRTVVVMMRNLSVLGLVLLPAQVFALSPFSEKSTEIRRQIEQVESELQVLPVSPINTTPWTLGFSSSQQDSPEAPVEIEIHFPEPRMIDLVALLPATYTDDQDQVKAFGFPKRFSIERLLPDGSWQMIADHLDKDYLEPGTEPQLFPCLTAVPTVGLRIISPERTPNPTWWKASHIVALSEVFAFEGDQNVALNAAVEASSAFTFSYVWAPSCLTDGFSLFSPIDHSLTNPMENFKSLREQVSLELDLGEIREIDEFHLWPVVHSIQHNFPSSSGIGFPDSMKFEIASEQNFSDAKVIYDEKKLIHRPGAGPFMRQIPPVSGRYLRLTLKNGLPDFRRMERVEITLSEIEFLEKGQVVSRGVSVKTPTYSKPPPGTQKLTDGISSEGEILPLRQWVIQFKRRVELKRQLISLRAELDVALIKEEKFTTLSLFIALGLIVVLIQVVWLVRVAAKRRWMRMRERIACDLHDEIGANVSSIAHTAELLDETIAQPSETQSRLLTNLIESARLTSRETKHFVRFIEGEDQDRDLTEQFVTVADQILGTIPTRPSYQNIASFNRLDPSTKWNLLLFFKEALNNIIKHAGATSVEISTRRTGSQMQLIVSDNGRGIPEEASCRHLESRAKMLNGQLIIRSSPGEGTRIMLTFKRNAQP
jgi:signal transduction histidine kinase